MTIRIFAPKEFDLTQTITSWIVHADGTIVTHHRNGERIAKYMSLADLEMGVRDGRFVEVTPAADPPNPYTRSYFAHSH